MRPACSPRAGIRRDRAFLDRFGSQSHKFDFANFEDRLESLERLGRCEKWKTDTLLKVGIVKYFESTGARRSSCPGNSSVQLAIGISGQFSIKCDSVPCASRALHPDRRPAPRTSSRHQLLGTAVARRCQRLAGGRWCSSVKAVGSPCEPCTSTASEEWAMLAMERLRCWNLRLPPWPARHWRVYRLHCRHTMPVTLYSS